MNNQNLQIIGTYISKILFKSINTKLNTNDLDLLTNINILNKINEEITKTQRKYGRKLAYKHINIKGLVYFHTIHTTSINLLNTEKTIGSITNWMAPIIKNFSEIINEKTKFGEYVPIPLEIPKWGSSFSIYSNPCYGTLIIHSYNPKIYQEEISIDIAFIKREYLKLLLEEKEHSDYKKV